MKISFTAFLIAILGATAAYGDTVKPNLPDGYAEFQWGTEMSVVLKAIPKTREVYDGKIQKLEKTVFGKKKIKKKRGSKGLRLRNIRFWKQLGGLPARVELRFFDGVLYAARVHLLYRRKDQRKLKVLYDALLSKYGEPMTSPEDAQSIQDRNNLRFAMADGALQIDKLNPRKGHRGLFRFLYRSDSLGTQVTEYHKQLEANLMDQKEAAMQRKKDKKRKRSERVIKRVKDEL